MNNKKLPERKQLRLKNFDYSENNAFFITICTYNRNRLFGKVENTTVGATLPDIIGWFKTMTTNEYIKGVKNKFYQPFYKHFWQRGYFEHVIRNENDLFECRKYIEQNLLKWIIDKK